MTDERGSTLVELLVSSLAASVVLGGLFALYLATSGAFAGSNSQAVLQRQGTLGIEQIARQVRSATAELTTCNGVANTLQVTNSSGTYCYHAGAAGELCEAVGANCRDLLAGALKPLALLRQRPAGDPRGPDPRCPASVLPSDYCLAIPFPPGTTTSADLAFTVADAEENAMAFSIGVTRRN